MTNYDTIAEEAKGRFLQWDQEKLIGKFGLAADANHFYLSFCGAPYRIDRSTARTERLAGERPVAIAGFHEIMSIFDLLCYGKESAGLSGNWISSRELAQGVPNFSGSSIFAPYERRLEDAAGRLREIFAARGYPSFSPGDAACVFPVFSVLPAVFQFWQGEEPFPATLRFLWDANTLDFLHYETTYYVAVFWLEQRLKELEGK